MGILDRVAYRARKLAAMTTHHLDCGMYSGSPTCCVLWSTFVYYPVERFDRMFELEPRPKWHIKVTNIWATISNPVHAITNRRLGRIPCPWCAAFGSPIKMNKCDGHVKCKNHLCKNTMKND